MKIARKFNYGRSVCVECGSSAEGIGQVENGKRK